MHRASAGKTAAERAGRDEARAIQSGAHFQRCTPAALPRYGRTLEEAHTMQIETIAWLSGWPRTDLPIRTWLERWDGKRWIEIEGCERIVG